MDKSKKTLLENFLSLGAIQVITYIIPFITLPYLSRVLGVENFGIVFFAQAFMMYFITLTSFGFSLSATREIAVNRHNQNNISNIFNSVMAVKFVLMLVSFIILLISIYFIPNIRAHWLVFILTFFMVIGWAIFPDWLFQGMERMKYITFLNILSKSIFLVLIFVFVKKDSDYILVPILNSLGFITSGIIGLFFAIKTFKLKIYIPSLKSIIKQFKYSSEFFLSRASATLYTNTNTFCIGLINSPIMVAYYTAAQKIYLALNNLTIPITGALYPHVSKNKNIAQYKKIFTFAVIINIFVCAFVFIFAKPIITIFYGAEMTDAYKILRIFAVALTINIPGVLLGYPLLGALGYTKETNGSTIISSIIHVIGLLILFLTGKMNVYTIACMVSITITIVFVIRLFYVIKYKVWRFNKAS